MFFIQYSKLKLSNVQAYGIATNHTPKFFYKTKTPVPKGTKAQSTPRYHPDYWQKPIS